jgi:mRNA interferase RelE/StbE/toxin YoeB
MKLEISEQLDKKLRKLRRHTLTIIDKKVQQILKNPEHFKPLSGELHGARRVHIETHFVLTYEYKEKEQVVRLLDYDHHDKIY